MDSSKEKSEQLCKFCGNKLKPEDVFENTVICSHCNGYYDSKTSFFKKHSTLIKITSVLTLLLVAFLLLYMGVFDSKTARQAYIDNVNSKIQGLSAAEIGHKVRKCKGEYFLECRRLAFKKMSELEPTNHSYLANYGFALAGLGKHQQAADLFKKVIDEGSGEYDLLAAYGFSLDALGNTDEAIKWYMNSLSVAPNIFDVTQALAKALYKKDKPYQAISLLESFMQKHPSSKSLLKGNVVSMKNHKDFVEQKPADRRKIQLLAFAGGHHFLPIKLSKNSPVENFLIDTGATGVLMSTSTFIENFGRKKLKSADTAQFRVADGRIITGKVIRLQKFKVGPWTVNNIDISVCKKCQNLAGKSLLKNFSMKTERKGNFEILSLSK